MAEVDIDVVVIGAGVSGINASYYLKKSTNLSYVVYDFKEEIGGTWSLFNFSGIRSDADMFSYGFPWRPWTEPEAISEGWKIKRYLKDTAREFGLDSNIKFKHTVKSADWSSKDSRWTLQVSNDKGTSTITSRFIICAAGYYSHEQGYKPDIPGIDNFKGQVVHPQFWPKDLKIRDRKVVILGSGATAASLLPALSRDIGSGSVTILQRSPSYYLTIPRTRPIINVFRKWFPKLTAKLMRFFSSQLDSSRFFLYRIFPNLARRYLRWHVSKQLPPHVPLDPHFNPTYMPWEQRLCFIPDGDFFKALRPGAGGHIETGKVKNITENQIELENGTKLECDLFIQATGLEIQCGGPTKVTVDGKPWQHSDSYWYRAHMLSGLPNYFWFLGSFFQTWTVFSETASLSFVRLWKYMQKNGYTSATPTLPDNVEQDTFVGVSSGYLLRAADRVPKVATKRPWIGVSDWTSAWWSFTFGRVDEDMVFK